LLWQNTTLFLLKIHFLRIDRLGKQIYTCPHTIHLGKVLRSNDLQGPATIEVSTITRTRLLMLRQVFEQATRHNAQQSRRIAPFVTGAVLLIFSLTACGQAPSDTASRNDARGSATQSAERGDKSLPAPTTVNNGPVPASITNNQTDGSPSTNAGTLTSETDEPAKTPVPGLPDTIAKDLDSPDARVRYRALDHWEKPGIKTPLDPVFEALEDEDEAIRTKATTIIEREWALEQEREKG
jgi:hypothetical protein